MALPWMTGGVAGVDEEEQKLPFAIPSRKQVFGEEEEAAPAPPQPAPVQTPSASGPQPLIWMTAPVAAYEEPEQPEPVEQVQAPEPPVDDSFLGDLKLAGKAAIGGLYQAATDTFPQTVGGAIRGTDVPLRDTGVIDRMIADQQRDIEAKQLSPEEKQRRLFGIIDAGDIESGAQSVGYSAATLVPSIAAKAGGAALGSLIPVPGVGTAAGYAAGAGASYVIASRADMNQVLRQKRDQLLELNPNMTEQEWEGVKQEVNNAVKMHGRAEGGWEAAGNALQLAILSLGSKWGVGRPIIAKIAGIATGAVGDIPIELATEAKTQQAQAEAEREMGLREPGAPLTFMEAVGEVGPQTLVTTLLTMGLGGTAAQVGKGIQHGQFVRNKPNMVQGLEDVGIRPEIIEKVKKAQTYEAYQKTVRENAVDIMADTAISMDFQGITDTQAEQLLARMRAKYPEHRQTQVVGSQDPRDAIRAIVEIQRGLAPGALRRPTATMRPTATAQPQPAKPDPTAGVTYGSEEDQSRRDELVQTPEEFDAEIDSIVAYFDAQEAAKAATTTTLTPAAENAPTGQPAAQPPPLSAPQAPAVSGPPSGPAPMPASPAAPAGQAVRQPPETPTADRGAAPISKERAEADRIMANDPEKYRFQDDITPSEINGIWGEAQTIQDERKEANAPERSQIQKELASLKGKRKGPDAQRKKDIQDRLEELDALEAEPMARAEAAYAVAQEELAQRIIAKAKAAGIDVSKIDEDAMYDEISNLSDGRMNESGWNKPLVDQGVELIREMAGKQGDAESATVKESLTLAKPAKGAETTVRREALGEKKAEEAPAPEAAAKSAKESWEMTGAEYARGAKVRRDMKRNYVIITGPDGREVITRTLEPGQPEKGLIEGAHRVEVAEALREGKPVPKEVLADYPELMPVAPEKPKVQPSGLAVPAVEGRGDKYADWKAKEQIMAIAPAGSRSAGRLSNALKEAGVPHEFGPPRTLGSKRSSLKIPNTPEAINIVRRMGGTISKQQPHWLTEDKEPYEQKPTTPAPALATPAPVVTDTPDGVKVEVPMSAKAEAKVTPKEQKKYFIDQIDAAIDSATDLVPTRKNRKDATLGSAAEDFRANAEEIGTVEIEVPGDGTFTLLNTKDALRKLKARAAAMFPATPPTASAPSKPSGKPSAIAKVGPRPGAAVKPAWAKLLDPFTVKDKNPTPIRATMVSPLFNPAKNETVATDSSRLVVALGVKIGTPIQDGGPQYSYVVPGYRQNQLPQKQNDQQTVRVADTEQFIRQIRQAKMATEKSKSGPDTIALYAMPDGSVAVASMYAGDGYVSQDVSKGNMIGAYTADFVDEIVTFLRKTGNQAIEIRHRDEESPLVLLGAKEYAVLMPVRGTELNAPDALAGMVPREAPAAKPQARKDAPPPPAPESPAARAGELQDFGEKIGGARKDMVPSAAKEIADGDLAQMSFSQIWPKAEVDAIEDADMAALATALRNSIPAKPRKGYKVNRWVESVKTVRTLMQLANERGVADIVDRMRTPEYRLLGGLADKVDLLRQLPRDQWDRIGKVENYPDAYRYEQAKAGEAGADKHTSLSGEEKWYKRVPSPYATAEVDGRIVRTDNLDALPTAVAERLGVPPEASAMQFEIRGRVGSSVRINKKGDPLYRPLKEFTGETAVEQARAFIENSRDDLVAAWEAIKESDNVKESDVRRDANRPRMAKDYRQGRDVTPEMFSEAFGFRGVEFGNWVAQGANRKERQGMLNEAFDAFSDLADIIGVPSRALSLNGELAMAFGARGSGKFAAHYEPGKIVINLTKTRGAGSLAHEFFHALDHYFQRKRGETGVSRDRNFITYNPETYYQDKASRVRLPAQRFNELLAKGRLNKASDWTRIEGVRPEVEEAFSALVKALDESPMHKRASLIDKGKSGGYWSRIIERAARSFENYVIHKMAQKGYQNDYLANVASIEEFQRDAGRYPYLLDGELAPVAEAFDNLFATIQTRETERGVEMFAAAGLKAETADKGQYQEAERMEAAGNSRESIWRKTGWWKGPDGQWRFEIDDSQMKVLPELKNTFKNRKHAGKTTVDSVSYRQNDDGTFDVSFRKKDAKTTEDFITYSRLTGDELVEMLGPEAQRVISGMGEPTPWRWTDAEFKAPSGKLIDLPGIEMRVDDGIRLSAAIDHPELFRAYPQLRNVIVGFVGKNEWNAPEGMLAKTDDGTPVIILSGNESKWRTILNHEIQHAIQEIEGYARGGTEQAMMADLLEASRIPDTPEAESFWGKEKVDWARRMVRAGGAATPGPYQQLEQGVRAYRLLAGEVEARFVQRRLDMPPMQRKAVPPWQTMETMLREEGLLKPGQKPEDALIFRKELAGSPAESRMEAGYGTAGENEAGMAGRQDGGQLPAGAAAGYAGRDALPFGDRDGRQGALPDQERREVQAPARLGREIAEAEDTAAEIERHRAGTYAANFADAEPAPEYADTPEAQDAAAMLKAHGVERVHAVRGMKSLAVRMPDGTVFLDESLGAGSTGTALHELVHKWKREGNQKVKRIENAFQRSTAAAKRFILKLADSVESAIGNRADAVEYAEKHAAEEATAIVLDLMAKRGGKSALGLEKSDILAAFGGMAKQVENMARALADKAQAAKLAYLDGKAEQAAPEADATDRAYLAAVERGDMETAQEIVAAAAKRSGYSIGPVWHGTGDAFNEFDVDKQGTGYSSSVGEENAAGFNFTDDLGVADYYAFNDTTNFPRKTSLINEDGSETDYEYEDAFVKSPWVTAEDSWGKKRSVGQFFLLIKNPKTITRKDHENNVNTALELAREAIEDGHDGVIIEGARWDWASVNHHGPNTQYIVASPKQIKAGSTIVRDDAGRIIPPSERFNPKSDDIRYAASRPPAASEWDGAKVEQYKRKDGAVRFKVVVDGKSRRAGFGSAENAERYLNEQKARLEDDYAAVIRRTKASVADIAEARRKLTIELSNEKAVAADVVYSLFKAMTRLDIMTPVHRKEIAAEIKRTAQERKADPEGWAKRTTEKVWQIASRISYMKELNDIFDKKQPVVTENKTLQAKPKYDAFVNRWIAKAKEYAELTPEEVNQRIEAIDADQNNRLANRGEEMAEEIDESVRERHLLFTFGGLFHGADYARAKAAFEAAKDLVTEGREKFMEMENHRKLQAAAKRQQIIEETKGGRQIDGNELEMETRNKSIWELLSSAGNWLHSKVLSGPYLYNQAADTRKGVDDMSGEAVRQYEGEVRAIEDEERLNEIVREDLTGIMADAMGLADPAKNRAEAAKFSKILHGWRKKQKATGIFLHRAVRNARGDLIRIEQGSELRNSQTKLLTMFLIAKRAESAAKQRFTNEPVEIEGGFNSIMEALVHNGYTAETVAQIEKNLDPRLIKIGWKMLEYMRDHSRPEVEKATFRLLGAVPPMYGDWYFPMDRANDKRNVAGGRNAYTLVQGFMKMLTPNKLDFRPVDAFERFLSHFDDLNHVVSHIEIVDQQNRIFNHPDMQKTLRVYRGDAMRKAVNNHLDRLTLGGEAGMADSALRWFRSMFARSVIPNPTQTPKQMSSMILFSTRELPPGANLMDWFLGVGKAIASPRDALRFDAELNKYSVRWRERYGHGYNQQVREARRGATARDLLGKRMAWFEFMNAFPQAGDKISSLIGGRPIYDLWYKHFTEVEKNPPMVAREKAMRKFMDAVELTQQSGALPHLSDSQVGFAANFMMFKTQPTAMTRLWMNSVRNLAMKRGSVRDNVWNMVAVMIGQMAFQAAADAFFVAAFDDPDEWKRLRHNQVRAALFAPINGYLVLPEALLRLTKIAMKDKVYGEFAGDVSSYLDVVNDIENVVKMFMKEEEMDGNDWMDVAQGVGSIGGAFTGKPIAPTVRWGRGIYDAVTDPTLSTPGRIARGVGYGKQAAGQDKPRKTSASSSPYPWESPAARSPYAKMPWER